MAVDVFRRQMGVGCRCKGICGKCRWMFSGDRCLVTGSVTGHVLNGSGCFQETDVK